MPESTPGRDRLLDALRSPSRGQLVVGALLAVLGFSAVVQVSDIDRDTTYSGLREQDLIEILNAQSGTVERARSEVARLEEDLESLQSDATSRTAALTQTQERIRTLNIIAGLVPVTGPGIRVTVTETDGRASLNSLLDLVQELRTADAEAIEFNDKHRVVAQSAFNDAASGGIELDGELLETPYVIDVIGDPHALHGALTFGSGPIEQLEDFDGASVDVEELDALVIESRRTPERPVNAERVTAQ